MAEMVALRALEVANYLYDPSANTLVLAFQWAIMCRKREKDEKVAPFPSKLH